MKNKTDFPKTLIQIHYHNKPSGVMQVIRHYAGAFKKINGECDIANILICEKHADEKYPEFPDRSILPLPEAGYREFKNRTEFFSIRKKIITGISAFLLSENTKLPVAIIAHNLTLCKNAALVSAFAELARAFASPKYDFRFFSAAHDFAQEGRVAQLQEILKLEKRGVAIKNDIAAAGAPVGFIAINERARTALNRAGIKASLLANPVSASPIAGKSGGEAKKALVKFLAGYSKRNRIEFRPGRPVIAYPARTIIRKNPFEAVLVACIICNANLLLGSAGSGPDDKKRHAIIRKLAKEYRLPVITDIQKVINQHGAFPEFVSGDPVPLIYSGTDKILTCAVTEGFGYLLHEPWLYGTPVCGRRPRGFDSVSKKSDIGYYDILPIPAEWIDAESVRKKYGTIAGSCFAAKEQRDAFAFNVDEKLEKRYVDFALLDEKSQIDVIEKLLVSEQRKISLCALLERSKPGWPGLSAVFAEPGRHVVRENGNRIAKQFSMKRFTRQFNKCIRTIPKSVNGVVDWDVIGNEYGDAGGFRIP
jgi:hypothetical protein